MAKRKFTLTQDCRFGGEHLKAGSTISLDLADAADFKKASDLAASGRLVEDIYPPSTPLSETVFPPEPPGKKDKPKEK